LEKVQLFQGFFKIFSVPCASSDGGGLFPLSSYKTLRRAEKVQDFLSFLFKNRHFSPFRRFSRCRLDFSGRAVYYYADNPKGI